MNKFKVGDLVEVKQWDEMVEEFGVSPIGDIKTLVCFMPGMKFLCGRRV